jgi:outer membrane receptor protein involved in Fe transport
MKPMQRSLLAAAIVAALSASAYALPARAQDSQNGSTQKQDKKKPQELKKIIVTGSLIPTAEIETSTPVIKITAAQIKRHGYVNLYQALRAQPLSTGQVSGQQGAAEGSFTSGAQTISLLGLSPDFTLMLLDGHPLAQYPLLYNGQADIRDISSIPLAMVSNIQIVPGNLSSLYGSGAIAGVVNITLRHHVNGMHFNYQAGGYSDGGGTSQQLQLVGGYDKHGLSLVYGLQYLSQQPIWAYQRPLIASTNANPVSQLAGVPPIPTYGVYDFNLGSYIDPNTIMPNGCGNIANQYGGTTIRYQLLNPPNTPGGPYVGSGQYACGSPNMVGFDTLANRDHNAAGYLSAHYRISGNTEAYATLLYNFDSKYSFTSPYYNFWEPNILGTGGVGAGVIFNENTGTYQVPALVFAPENMGMGVAGTNQINRAYNFFGGVKGSIGSSNWNYDAYLARSQNNLVSNQLHPLTSKVDAFFQNQFLGPLLGYTGGPSAGYPIYAPNYTNYYQNFTPADYQSFSGIIHTDTEAYTQNANVELTNTRLFELPAGHVGFAGVLQAGDEKWSLPTDPALESGQFWGETGSSGGGTRDNYAAATEFRIPITSMLSAQVSARYDHFHNDGGSTSSRPTYRVALSFRPIDTLLLRANYSTAFRMPDMGYVFVGPSGFYEGVTDYYNCNRIDPSLTPGECQLSQNPNINYDILGTQKNNPYLQPITAKSWGGGFVWSPTSNFDIKADYYDVRIRNEVEYQDLNTLMLNDSQCLLGELPADSPLCVQALSQITRAGANGPAPYHILGAEVQPVNIANERVSGIVASTDYRYDAGRYGDFELSAHYNVTLHHEFQLGAGQPTYDFLHDPYYDYQFGGSVGGPEFKSIFTGTLTWNIGDWTTALTGVRYGRLPNYAWYSNVTQNQSYGAGVLPPWILYNATVKYDIGQDASVTLAVNNVFNTMPPIDKSFQSGLDNWPFYDNGAYNAYGRSYYVDFNYRF